MDCFKPLQPPALGGDEDTQGCQRRQLCSAALTRRCPSPWDPSHQSPHQGPHVGTEGQGCIWRGWIYQHTALGNWVCFIISSLAPVLQTMYFTCKVKETWNPNHHEQTELVKFQGPFCQTKEKDSHLQCHPSHAGPTAHPQIHGNGLFWGWAAQPKLLPRWACSSISVPPTPGLQIQLSTKTRKPYNLGK